MPVPPELAARAEVLAGRFRSAIVEKDWPGLGDLLGSCPVRFLERDLSARELVDDLRLRLDAAHRVEVGYSRPARLKRLGGLGQVNLDGWVGWMEPYFEEQRHPVSFWWSLAEEEPEAWEIRRFGISHGLRIHAGCGPESFFPRLLDGWINLDRYYNHPQHGPVELTAEWPFHDGAAAAVYSEDFVEHLDQRHQVIYFAEAFRVLQPGGILRTTCPELCETIVRERFFPRWPRVGVSVMNGGAEWLQWEHLLIPTYEYLARVLELVGFTDIKRVARHESDIPDFPGDKRPLDDRREQDELYVEAVRPLLG